MFRHNMTNQVKLVKHHIEGNFGGGKHWQIWQMTINFPKLICQFLFWIKISHEMSRVNIQVEKLMSLL